MLAMLAALVIAHAEWDLGGPQTLKSAIGWLKGWALLAMFPLAGACLAIRPAVVVRASSWFAVQTLALIPFLFVAGLAHLPQRLFVSPVSVIGGPGPEFFSVYLYTVDPSNGGLRWQFVAPWSPAAGMLGDMIFVLAGFEGRGWLRWTSRVAAVLICLMTMSRMAILFLVFYPPLMWCIARATRPGLQAALGVVSLGGALSAAWIERVVSDSIAAFRGARADSTRVRETLGRMALERWRLEAPVFGHGVVTPGPHLVEYMPIGSHHTWYGLLYVKGMVGLLALALPLVWSLIELLLLAQKAAIGRLGFGVVVLLGFYSGGENLEILSYLFWPGMLVLGSAHAACRLYADRSHLMPAVTSAQMVRP